MKDDYLDIILITFGVLIFLNLISTLYLLQENSKSDLKVYVYPKDLDQNDVYNLIESEYPAGSGFCIISQNLSLNFCFAGKLGSLGFLSKKGETK